MTFIASIVATDGIAIVADSFVTEPSYSIDADDFIEYLKTKKNKSVKEGWVIE